MLTYDWPCLHEAGKALHLLDRKDIYPMSEFNLTLSPPSFYTFFFNNIYIFLYIT